MLVSIPYTYILAQSQVPMTDSEST